MALAVQTQSVLARETFARPLVLWHLLSLDAPTVAALWTWFIARTSGVWLPASSLVSMFLAVWILYVADRLLDAAAPATELEARHHFHARYRRPFQMALAAASLVLAPMLLLIPAAAMHLYLELGATLFAWFVLIHVPPGRAAAPRRLPKELAVGLFFAAATFVPTVSHMPALRLHLLPAAALFAALCSLNCLFIYAWEHRSPRSRGSANPTTRMALHSLNRIALMLVVAALALAWLQHSPVALAIALSASLLRGLDRWPPADPTVLRASADLALLTPLPFLAVYALLVPLR